MASVFRFDSGTRTQMGRAFTARPVLALQGQKQALWPRRKKAGGRRSEGFAAKDLGAGGRRHRRARDTIAALVPRRGSM